MKYFIDCGTHFFQGLKQFSNLYSFDKNWKIYSFEANPYTFMESKKFLTEGLENLNITHNNLAVSTKNDKIIINCDCNENSATGQGSNILLNPPSKDIVHTHTFTWKEETVNSFDLSEFIMSLEDVDRLVIKLDIEGSEFDVLKKIINDGSYKKINDIYVEFHERFFLEDIEKYINLKNNIISFFKNQNINILVWS